MQLPFATSDGVGPTSSSTMSTLHNDALSKTRSRTGLAKAGSVDEGHAQKSKATGAFSGLLRRMSRQTDRSVKTIRSPSSKPKLQSLGANEAALDRIMGKPKDTTHASKARPDIRAQSRSKTRVSRPTDEHQRREDRAYSENLTVAEAQTMFVGAPYFHGGVRLVRPQVIFVDQDSRVYSPALTDCQPFEHSSFEASSLAHDGPSVEALPPLRGTEPGTIGFEQFLQLAASKNIDLDPPTFKNRRLLTLNPAQIGVRELNTDGNIDRLAELGVLRQERLEHERVPTTTSEERVAELGHHLFATLLYPFGEAAKSDLSTQIEALQSVLALPGLWHNFSRPDTRLRIGQLLWSAPQIPRRPSYEERYLEPSDREITIFQITLASELLVRLDLAESLCSARRGSSELFSESIRVALEGSRSLKVKWDLVLAERFLDNVTLSARIPNKTVRNGLFSRVPYLVSREGPEPFYEPRNATKQIAGLVKFAQALKWPTAATLEEELMAILMQPDEESQPISPWDQGPDQHDLTLRRKPSGFTGDLEYSSRNDKAQAFLGISRRPSRPHTGVNEPDEVADFGSADSLRAMRLHPRLTVDSDGRETNMGGWLSQSWLSGLVLPGDAASHFLMTTLLENTPSAIETLGEIANLTGGFVYKGRSYWSKHCVVGRVMAAVRGARDCMGWVSVSGVPSGQKEGWVQIDSKDAPHTDTREPEAIGRASDPMGSGDIGTIQQNDFTLARDSPLVMGNQVKFEGLTLKKSAKRNDTGKGLTASITFSSPINSKLSNLEVELRHNVHFVSAYPCQNEESTQKIPISEEEFSTMFVPNLNFTADEIAPTDSARLSRPIMAVPSTYCVPDDPGIPLVCHALHKDYEFETISVAALLLASPERRPQLHTGRTAERDDSTSDHVVVVLDCRGSKDLQLLGRAWCAQMGENAIIAKIGRTCLSCAIREAYALAIAVVIRI